MIENFNSDKSQFEYKVEWSGKKVTLKFDVYLIPDRRPLKTIRIFWGVGSFTNTETVFANNEATEVLQDVWEYTYTYSAQQLLGGRTLCVEVTDNWGVKRVVCGKFKGSNNSTYVDHFCSDFAHYYDTASQSVLIESVFNQCQVQQ